MSVGRVFKVPPVIHFGQGVAAMAGQEASRLGTSRPCTRQPNTSLLSPSLPDACHALLITDSFLASSGLIQPVLQSLRDAKVAVTVYDQVNTEPTLAHVDDCLGLFAKNNADLVIGLGGGSPIDVAKAVSAMVGNPGELKDYMGIGKLSKNGPPIIAIPTTAGTGSEATCTTIITDTDNNRKMLIISDTLMPQVAIVDPLLTMSMPKGITAATGLDALTHAIEAYVSRKAQPMSDIFALSAVSLLARHLPKAWENPDDVEARTNTLLGALQAGIAFSNASVALIHGMSRPVGAIFHVAHGVSNAALLGVVTRFSLPGAYRRYAEVAKAMGIEDQGSYEATALAGAQKIDELIAFMGIPGLAELGVTKEKLDTHVSKMADDALASGSPDNNPKKASKDDIISLYYKAL